LLRRLETAAIAYEAAETDRSPVESPEQKSVS
jgi:hypothetical protein